MAFDSLSYGLERFEIQLAMGQWHRTQVTFSHYLNNLSFHGSGTCQLTLLSP